MNWNWLYQDVPNHCYIPWHLGRAWYRCDRQTGFCVLLPFNWPVGLGRSFYLWISHGPGPSRWDEKHRRMPVEEKT